MEPAWRSMRQLFSMCPERLKLRQYLMSPAKRVGSRGQEQETEGLSDFRQPRHGR